MPGECRNCGAARLNDLGPIGRVAPFFLKRALGIELRIPTSDQPLKQAIRRLAAIPNLALSRVSRQFAYVEMQICLHCKFIQTKHAFHDDDIMRLYHDYRSASYNKERIDFEPSYSKIAAEVGLHEAEIRNRAQALSNFLRGALKTTQSFSILDYGGSDGRFIPDFPASKFVYEVSNVDPVPGVTRIHSESELGTYSLVLLAHVTEHVPHPLDLVRKLTSYIEPGGYLYVETPQEIADHDLQRLYDGSGRFEVGIHEHINSYSVSAVNCLLESAGLIVDAIEKTQTDFGWAKADIVRSLGRKAH